MSLGLSRKQSAPAMSLYLPPPVPATEGLDPQKLEASPLPRSCSAPMAPISPGGILPNTCLVEKNGNEGEVEVRMRDNYLKELARTPSTKSVLGLPYQAELAATSERNLLQDPSPYHSDKESSNDCDFAKYSTIAPASLFAKEMDFHSTIKKPLEGVPRDQRGLISHSPVLSKRLSSRCLKAFRKLRSPSTSSPEYHILNDCDTGDIEVEAISNLGGPYLSPPTSPQVSVMDLGSTDIMSQDITEAPECLTELRNFVIKPSTVCSDAAVVASSSCNSLQQEAKDTNQKNQPSLLKIANDLSQETLEKKFNNHVVTGTLRKPSSEAPSKVLAGAGELGDNYTQNKVIEKTQNNHNERLDNFQPGSNTILDSSYKENPKNLEKIGAEPIHKETDTCAEFIEQVGCHNFQKKDLEETPKKSRLTTWKEKAKIENWLGKKKGISRHLPGRTNPEPSRLKKSPSLLFRLWSPTMDSVSEGIQQNEAAKISQQNISHPLEEIIATRARKGREQVLHDASQLRFNDITNKRKKSSDSKRALRQIFKENEPTVEDSTLAPLTKLSDISSELPSISLEKQGKVSWNGSIQEYAGSMGQVCPSGKRSVSDIFRSGETKPPSLKFRVELGTEASFEDSSLAADWHVAMRAMEEISSAELKLKRTGAVKHKRMKKGDKGPKSDGDCRKDGIGRSFSHEGGLSVADEKSTSLVHDILGEPRDSDSEKSIMSPFTSQESLYKFLEFS